MTDQQISKLASFMAANGHDWYAVLQIDETIVLRHNTALSSILQCGHDPIKYGIDKIYRCGADNFENAKYSIDLV